MKGDSTMRRFETPEVEVTAIDIIDIITTSDDPFVAPEQGENQTPYG
jgi:hypothetical protein